MKAENVKAGEIYVAKVNGKQTRVQIESREPSGTWLAKNLQTNRTVRIADAAKLEPVKKERKSRVALTAPEAAPVETNETPAPKKAKAPKEAKEKKMSCLDAAAKVLGEAEGPMNCGELIAAIFEKGYWKSDAPTPHATLYSAILRETQKKGAEARFTKVERGKFALANRS